MPIAIKDNITRTFDTINPNLRTMLIFLLTVRMFRAITTDLDQNQELAGHFARQCNLDPNDVKTEAARQLNNYINEKATLARIKKFFKN